MAAKKKGTSMASTSGLELEINELRSSYARIEARLSERAQEDDEPSPKDLIMQALSTARGGKPGSLTVAQLIEQCNLTKSAVHTHVKSLEKDRKVWRRDEHDPVNKRPCTMVYDARIVRVS
jgi:hypothetical protein